MWNLYHSNSIYLHYLQVGQYVESKPRTSSLRHRSRWLIFELTDGVSRKWIKWSEKIDNLARVTLPLYVLGKGETTKVKYLLRYIYIYVP